MQCTSSTSCRGALVCQAQQSKQSPRYLSVASKPLVAASGRVQPLTGITTGTRLRDSVSSRGSSVVALVAPSTLEAVFSDFIPTPVAAGASRSFYSSSLLIYSCWPAQKALPELLNSANDADIRVGQTKIYSALLTLQCWYPCCSFCICSCSCFHSHAVHPCHSPCGRLDPRHSSSWQIRNHRSHTGYQRGPQGFCAEQHYPVAGVVHSRHGGRCSCGQEHHT